MTEREWAAEIVANAAAPATIIELGAHHGNDTVQLYDACVKPCRYVAVEADPRNVPVLCRRLLGRPVNVMHAAVWDDCGEIPFHLCEGNANGSSSARVPLKHLECFPSIPFQDIVQVPALTLDAISDAYGIQHCVLIWSDIQGAERNMVAGGKQTLKRTSWLLTECDRIEMYAGQATRDELLSILGAAWELVAEWPENANLLLRNRAIEWPETRMLAA
jgi:FkbM family methyltransferase